MNFLFLLCLVCCPHWEFQLCSIVMLRGRALIISPHIDGYICVDIPGAPVVYNDEYSSLSMPVWQKKTFLALVQKTQSYLSTREWPRPCIMRGRQLLTKKRRGKSRSRKKKLNESFSLNHRGFVVVSLSKTESWTLFTRRLIFYLGANIIFENWVAICFFLYLVSGF